MRLLRTRKLMAIVFGISVATCAVSAQARDILLLAGGDFADRSFSQYTGIITPFKAHDGAFNEDGARLRFWQKTFAFSYTTDLTPAGPVNARIDAVGGSFTGEIGYQKKFPHGQLAGYAGLTYRHFDLSPDDPGADLNKNRLGIPFTLEGSWQAFDKVSISSNFAYTAFHEDYWAQLKFGYQATPTLKLGPEIVFQGGSEYRYLRLGAFVSGIRIGAINLSVNSGLRQDIKENKQSLYGDLHISFFY